MHRRENRALVYALITTSMIRKSQSVFTTQRVIDECVTYVSEEEAKRIVEGVNMPELSAIEIGRLGVAFYNGKLDNFYSFRRHKFLSGITFHRVHSLARNRIRLVEVASSLSSAQERLESMSPEEIITETHEFDGCYAHQEPVFDII